MIVCGGRGPKGRVKGGFSPGNGGENSWSSSSRVSHLLVSTAGQEFSLAFGVPFPPSLCSFLQAVDKFPPYKSVTGVKPQGGNLGTNGLKGKEPGLQGRRKCLKGLNGGSLNFPSPRHAEELPRKWITKVMKESLHGV